MGRLLTKPGVDYGAQAGWAGARILEVAKVCVVAYPFDVTVTSARDGDHSGPLDPHRSGEAFDFRTHDLPPGMPEQLCRDLSQALGVRFYAFLEALGTPNAHLHVQRAKGTLYGPLDYLRNA